MDDDTTLGAVLLGLDGFVLCDATLVDGEVQFAVETTGVRVGCPDCAVVAIGHGRRAAVLRDLPVTGRPCRLVWAKRIGVAPMRVVTGERGRNDGMTWCCPGMC